MKISCAAALVCIAAAFGAAEAREPNADRQWVQYRNERFGLSLRYPAHIFGVERTAEAGDGQVLVAHDSDARLLVGVISNDASYTAATYQAFIAQQSYGGYEISYRRLGSSWFVLSGEGNGRTFYEKVMFSCGGRFINSFAMVYPTAERNIFAPIIEHIEDTFRPGICEQRASREKIAQRPQAHRRAHRQSENRRQYVGRRSELADRIARQRGQNVIVILRRRGPPYDYKVLRGYVSR